MNLQINPTTENPASSLDGLGTLLRQLIDYAGLFPPASLSMAQTVANYDEYSRSEWNWMLGRLIVPVARLGEFETALAGLPFVDSEIDGVKWQLSVLLGTDASEDVARVREFNDRLKSCTSRRAIAIESVEVKAANAAEVLRLSSIIPAETEAYFEVPLSSASECVRAISSRGRRAKIRMGGETADKFPAPQSVINFISMCAAGDVPVPFKATAGLHHPIRSRHRLTYDSNSETGMMHGFLNVFLTAAFLRAGMDETLAVELLEEQSAREFHFDRDGVRWRDQRITCNEIAMTRESFAVSFGSCSFTEPVEDLRSLHLL